MYEVFTKLLNMSLTASILVLIVIILRFALKKAPKKYICILWALVAFRLICPFSISSVFSAYNMLQEKTVSNGQVEYFEYNGKTEKPQLTFEVPAFVNDEYSSDRMTIGSKTLGVYMPIVVYIWIFGMIGMFVYAAVSYGKLHKEVRVSIKKGDNIFVCDEINSPFILGLIHPKIYLPSGISNEVRENVVAHEQAHVNRLDYIWKPLGFFLLSVYWFNPLMWVAYIFLCKDIEAACDEKVISQMDRERIVDYSQALLACASQRRMITACPIAFGETDVKGRIKNVLNYKKPAFWIIFVSIVACSVMAICFLTNPKEKHKEVVSGLYTYGDVNKNPMEGISGLLVNEDGTFSFSPGFSSSYLGSGTWKMDGDYMTFIDIGLGDVREEVFQYVDGKLYYVADKSAVNSMWGVTDRAEYIHQDSASLIDYLMTNSDFDMDGEIGSTENEDVVRDYPIYDGSGNTVSISDYTDELIFNFGGRFYLSDTYKEPIHGDYVPIGWHALGGEGECIDPSFSERETFVNGKLIAYDWLDNHSGCRAITSFSVGGYSCCLYQYSFGLFSAPDLEQNPDVDSTSEYWVIFYTEGEGMPLYVKYYNCDYFTQEQATESIVPGLDIIFGTDIENK